MLDRFLTAEQVNSIWQLWSMHFTRNGDTDWHEEVSCGDAENPAFEPRIIRMRHSQQHPPLKRALETLILPYSSD